MRVPSPIFDLGLVQSKKYDAVRRRAGRAGVIIRYVPRKPSSIATRLPASEAQSHMTALLDQGDEVLLCRNLSVATRRETGYAPAGLGELLLAQGEGEPHMTLRTLPEG